MRFVVGSRVVVRDDPFVEFALLEPLVMTITDLCGGVADVEWVSYTGSSERDQFELKDLELVPSAS